MLKSYLKIALRSLLKHKSYSLINLAGLTIGIMCCILILLWVQHEVNFDRFHTRHDRIYRIVKLNAQDVYRGIVRAGAPWGPALQEEYPEVEAFVRFRHFGRTLVKRDDKGLFEDNGFYTDSTFFDVFSFKLLKGDQKTALTEPNAVVLTQDLANKLVPDRNPLGARLEFDGATRVVTGVVQNPPENSHLDFAFLVPFSSYALWDKDEWDVSNFYVYLLLEKNADIKALEAKFPDFQRRHITSEEAEQTLVRLQPLTDIHLHSNYERELQPNGNAMYVTLFSVVAILVVLIACINFMNLSTAKSAKRAREIGIRKVVGSLRTQLIQQFLSETMVLSFLALLAALVLVELLLPAFSNLTGKTLALDFSTNEWLLPALLALALVVGLLAGVYPAFYLSRFRPTAVLKGDWLPGSGRTWLRKALVVFQFSISVALILATFLVNRQLDFISNKRLGFDHSQMLVIRITDSSIEDDYQPFKQALLAHNQIMAATASGNLLGGSDWGMPFIATSDSGEQRYQARTLLVDHDFVGTLQMEIVKGRDFSDKIASDVDEAMLINETAAQMYNWSDPVGMRFKRIDGQDEQGNTVWQTSRIVGVVKDFHFRSLHEEIRPMVMFIQPGWFRFLSIRLNTQYLAETLRFVESTWRQFEPERPLDYFFLDSTFDELYRSEKRLAQIFVGFSGLAILIACLGLFGLAALSAEQRTKEVGIRKVLGASVAGIVGLLSREFMLLVLLANLIAWPVAYYVMQRWLENFAYRVGVSWWLFAVAGGMALLIALLTVSTQAIRAGLANPVDSLRYE